MKRLTNKDEILGYIRKADIVFVMVDIADKERVAAEITKKVARGLIHKAEGIPWVVVDEHPVDDGMYTRVWLGA